MAKALRRGIARYQHGTEDVVPDPHRTVQSPGQTMRGVQAGQQSIVAAPPTTGFGQLMAGQFKAAQQNPASSPATAALGQFADYLSRSTGLDAVSRGPSMKDRLGNFFFGNQASTAAIEQHDAASKALRDPLVQQHLLNNPDELAMAQQDRVGYATKTQTPEFRKKIEQAVAATTAVAAESARPDTPVIDPADQPKVVGTMVNTPGVSAAQAHAATNPRRYTRDEFIKTFEGIPTATFALLFGNQLQHVKTPQEKVATQYFDRLQGAHSAANARVNAMIAEDEALRKQGKNPIHSQSSWFGKSPLDIAREQQAASLKAVMDAAAAYTGISQKPYQVPGQQ